MEASQKQNWSLAGIARILVTLVLGLVLGAFFYSRYVGTGPSPQPSAGPADTEKSIKSETSSDVVQISPASQKEVGIAVETAGPHNLREILSATGIVSEDPVRVAHLGRWPEGSSRRPTFGWEIAFRRAILSSNTTISNWVSLSENISVHKLNCREA